ncbi:MAG TPA: AsnC family transcriptional regulator [Pseudonocardiaceae bacterium]|nr:AsnC family transcriptional regulator [Pseudonocardiaceae bacterium]
MLDELDRGLVHALQLDGRAPFARIAMVLGTSEHTVARRYRRLRSGGVVRVVGAVNGFRLGYASWTVRLRCTPDAAGAIAAALARRSDTFWVHVLSGGTEISCNLQAGTDAERDGFLLEKLPGTRRVLGMSAHSMLRGFAGPTGWAGLATLSDEQMAALRVDVPEGDDEPVALAAGDRELLGALASDGRLGFAELAAASGLSESTVRRRLEQLRGSGVLSYQVEIAPVELGYRAEARLWMSVRPSAVVSVAQALAGHAEVSFCAVTTGPSNLVAAVVCRDSRHLYRYLTEQVGALDAIDRVEAAPLIRTVKRSGAVLPG